MKSLVSSQWLFDNISEPDLIILDATPKSSDEIKCITGARFFDLKNDFSDNESKFPNTFPSNEQFEKSAQKLGINNSSKIVIYDNKGTHFSPRVWWMFKTMGHENVAVLDGGLPDWISSGFNTTIKFPKEYAPGNFNASLKADNVKDYAFIKSNVESNNSLVIDARSYGRFEGTEPEPRTGLRSGHIPNSINIPYTEVLVNGKYKPKAKLAKVFNVLKTEKRPLIYSCGSGLTACILLLASEMLLENETAIYDGSWTEWAQLES